MSRRSRGLTSLAATLLITGVAAGPAGALETRVDCKAWQLVPFPVVKGGHVSGLSGTSSTDVWTVGGIVGPPGEPIIRHWDGVRWQRADQERVGDGELTAVTAISPTDAWAVGPYGPQGTLVMHWDGTIWKVVPTPSPGTSQYLYDVSAVSSDDVWAVGNYTGFDGIIHGMTLHWDGRSWAVVPAPDATPHANVFYGVSVRSSDDVWAVGYRQPDSTFAVQPLIEHWDGTEWMVATFPDPPFGTTNELTAVRAIAPDDAWAVGFFGFPEPSQPLVEHWDGSDWTLINVPHPINNTYMYGVDGVTRDDVWMVGAAHGRHGQWSDPMTMHWDGVAGHVVRMPRKGLSSYLFSVWASSAEDIWAGGGYFNPEIQNSTPLTVRSRGPCS